MEIVNLTPHKVCVYDKDGKNVKLKIESSGVIRVPEEEVPEGSIMYNGAKIEIVKKKYLAPPESELPKERDGLFYIVSLPVAQALKSRNDLLVPDTGPSSAVRDSSGRILGVKRLMRIS